jgi:hypothetical protein
MADTKTTMALTPRDDSDRFRLWRDSRRTAGLGTSASGKSVFLTSVIDRLTRLHGKTTIVRAVWHMAWPGGAPAQKVDP